MPSPPPPPLPPPLSPARRRQGGATLVLTLAILVLVLGLAVALFLAAGNEVRSVTYYKNSLGLRELSDTAVNLVMVQIKDATTANATAAPASRSTWASQPGMIRTYGSSTNASMSYKLYSWDSPRVSGDDTTTVPTTWSSTPALYTDLNEPIPSSSAPSDTNAYRYPIAYPPPTNPSSAPLGYSIASTAPLGAVSGATFTNSVPMPVQWLYILQDGTVANGTNASGTTVTISGATAANPIVARVAYWTDDETSKVNISTAAGGEFWMRPVSQTPIQWTNAIWQPTRWEFQRYPGHPARTDLQAVFPDLTRQQIWDFTPRVSDNGATAASAVAANLAGSQPSTNVPYDSDRLFASVGEARFSATNTNSGGRADFTNNWPDRIEQNKFLITSSSRAPEVTLYGTPRVSIWPIPANTNTNFRTTLDRLFAFCSTIQNTTTTNNPRPYYFVHSTATNVVADASNPTNTNMFTYLDSLSGCSAIPGIGSVSLDTKYTLPGRDQLVTQFYDYIRSVNKYDNQLSSNRFASSSDWIVPPTQRISASGTTNYGFGNIPTINQVALHFICTADGANTNSANSNNLSLWTNTNSASYVPLAANEVCIMAIAYIEPALPASAFPPAYYNVVNFVISGFNQLSLGGTNLNFPASATNRITTTVANISGVDRGDGGGTLKFTAFFLAGVDAKPFPTGTGGFARNSAYTLVSQPVRLTKASAMALTSGGPLTASVFYPTNAPSAAHAVTIPFPSSTNIAMPTLPANTNSWAFDPSGWNGSSAGRFTTNRVAYMETNLFLSNSDTVFAVATTHGDYRISMVRPSASANWSAVPASPSTPNFQHRLFNASGGSMVPGANYPTNALDLLPADVPARPPIPAQTNLSALGFAHPQTYGDFDNGLPAVPDGPYINANDEYGGWATGAYQGLYWVGTGFLNITTILPIYQSPNRKIASPVAFGSLPSAAVQNRPWQNLLFRPVPGVNHPGKAGFKIDGTPLTDAPPDHIWLDFFWMPVVEPWAISETFSTAGKINMNYQIAPFSYIRRTTGMQAVLKASAVTALSSDIATYNSLGVPYTGKYRKLSPSGPGTKLPFESVFPVNLDETLKGFDARLTNNAALFRTASEISELPIVPVASGATYTSMTNATGNWWANWRYTGDNTKEATYNDIYPRLTTKGNTYTVHYRVQMLKKLPGGTQSTWDESKDKVLSELRGSTLIERYLDPNATYPDYATAFNSPSLETFYKFRVLQRSDFTP